MFFKNQCGESVREYAASDGVSPSDSMSTLERDDEAWKLAGF